MTPRAIRTPIAATLRSGRTPSAGSQTPLRPATRPRDHAEVGAGGDQHLLEQPDIADHVHRRQQLDDRVAHQLARAVPGDPAAAVDVDRPVCRRSAGPRGWVRLPAVYTAGCSSSSTVSGPAPSRPGGQRVRAADPRRSDNPRVPARTKRSGTVRSRMR